MARYAEWILPCNTKKYDLARALNDLKIIEWRQPQMMKNAKVGDIIYIYTSSPAKWIAYKGAILKVGKMESTIDDRKYNIPESSEFTQVPCMEIAVFREYTLMEGLNFADLKAHGLKANLMGPVKVNSELSSYLHSMDLLQRESDRLIGEIPDSCVYPFPIEIQEDLTVTVMALDDSHTDEEKVNHADSLSIDDLKQIAEEQSKKKVKVVTTTVSQTYRDPYIAEYAKKRANGVCQLCNAAAPFNKPNGEPYLESHHIVWLSLGGEDSVKNTVALCPNCHKKMHVVNDQADVDYLMKKNGK